MKFTAVFALIASTQAVQLEYTNFFATPPPIWDVVKRGSERDFADDMVRAAMKTNPSSGEWPVPIVRKIYDATGDLDMHYVKQPWESVVKKGNSDFSDTQVAKAVKLIPEPIVINGKINPMGGLSGDAEAAELKALQEHSNALAKKAYEQVDQTVKP